MSKLVVISGPSGVGKGTIVNELKEMYEKDHRKLYLSVSATTRRPREGEIDGVNYYFITEEEFKKKIENEEFFEYNQYGTGKYYGTPKHTVMEYLHQGYDVILEIDVNGYKQIKEKYQEALGIFIMPPCEEELYNRLKNRGTENDDIIKIRIQASKEEIANKHLYDYIIMNENNKSHDAACKIYEIMTK